MRMGSRVQERPKRVMLVDDHAIVRKGLRALIESMPGWIVCAEAEDGRDALAIAAEAQPDLIILDISMPGIGGIDAASQLGSLIPGVAVIILTMHDSDHLAAQALQAGAIGYLLKGDSGESLIQSLGALTRNQPGNSAFQSNHRLDSGASRPERRPLTPRERQIVKLVAEGNTNGAIAALLRVSIKTVETHRLAAMRKTGARSSADLTRYAVRNNLVAL